MSYSRRSFIACAAGFACGIGLGFSLRERVKEGAGIRLRLRPPGALPEAEFLAACVRCGQCVEACPKECLLLSGSPDRFSLGTPYLEPEIVPCDLCQSRDERECIRVCPSKALLPVDEPRDVRMGMAYILEEHCLAYNQVICRACWHACPFPNEAISFDKRLRPVVNEEACVGCGLCTFACPTTPRAIPILPAGSPSNSNKTKSETREDR